MRERRQERERGERGERDERGEGGEIGERGERELCGCVGVECSFDDESPFAFLLDVEKKMLLIPSLIEILIILVDKFG